MSWAQKRRLRHLEFIVDSGMTYGVGAFAERNRFNEIEIWCRHPDGPEDLTVESRYEVAENSITTLATVSDTKVAEAYRFTKRILAGVQVKQDLLMRIEKQAADALRAEVMVELFKSGREDHPAYAVLAASTQMSQIRSIKAELARTAIDR